MDPQWPPLIPNQSSDIQTLEEQIARLSLSPSDPASVFNRNLLHNSSISDQPRLFAAVRTQDPVPNLSGSLFYPSYPNHHTTHLPDSDSGTGSGSGSSPLDPRNGLPPNFWDDLESARRLQLYHTQFNPSNYNLYLDNGCYDTGLDSRLYNSNNLISNGHHLDIHHHHHRNIRGNVYQPDHIHGGQSNGHLYNLRQASYVNYLRTLNNARNNWGSSNGGSNVPVISVKDQPGLSSDSLRGRVIMFVKDKKLSQFLLNEFEAGRMKGVQMVMVEIKENIVEVLFNQSGSQFFQKFLKHLDYHHVHELFRAIMDNVHICFDNHGTRAAQQILKHVDKNNLEVITIIVRGIRDVFRYAANGSQNGYHFIEAVFNAFLEVHEVVQSLMREAADSCVAIATDRVGCCKLQQIIGYGQGSERSRIINMVISHAVELSEDAFGNYVVGFIATREKEPHLNVQVVNRLKGYFADLSKDKFGSHVVQKILDATADEFAELMIGEICGPAVFLDMCQHCYGNFVVQTTLRKAKNMLVNSRSPTYHNLVDQIQAHYPFLHSHMYGSRVLNALNR